MGLGREGGGKPGREGLADGRFDREFIGTQRVADRVKLRTAITLREIEGLSYEEIAEMMDCPIGTVRSRIFRAREAIANKLRPLLDTPEGRRW